MPINLEKVNKGVSQLSVLNKTNSPIVYASLFLSILLCVLSVPITHFLFGSAYAKSSEIMAILSITVFIVSMTSIHAQFCIINNKNKDILRFNLLVLGASIILDTVLIQFFGLAGVAIGTVFSLLVALLLSCMLDYEFAKILRRVLFRPDFSYLSIFFSKLNVRYK